MSNELIPMQARLSALEYMSKNAHESKFFASLGGQAGILMMMLAADELGIPPMQAIMNGLHIIQGKVTLSPQLMNSMIRKAKHKMDIDSNDQRCIITGTRKDTDETCTVTFSVEDAKRAGIYRSGSGWDKYPSDMCFARALSRLARRLFPDVIGTSYVEGEIDPDAFKRVYKSEDTPVESAQAEQMSSLSIIMQRYPQHSEETVLGYAAAVSAKRNTSIEDFLKECIKVPALFENYIELWLKKESERVAEIDKPE